MQLLINKKISNTENLDKSSINQLKSLIDNILICVFCTDLKIDDGSTWRIMLVIKVCDKWNTWFFGENSSDKNKVIAANKYVKLFFAHLEKAVT